MINHVHFFQSWTGADGSTDAKVESAPFLSRLFIIQQIVVRVCERSDNTENTKKSILISESDGVHLRLWDHVYP